MPRVSIRRKPVIIGIMGSHKNDSPAVKEAYALGEAVAHRGYVLLTGGGGGVMKAASEGAHCSGGLVIAILPSEKKRPLKGYPNEFVDIPIYTGMYDARNIINAKTPDIIIALDGSAGTLSEIAIALKSGTPVIGLHCPRIDLVDDDYEFISVDTVNEAVQNVDDLVKTLKKE
ncbi:MAG: TIGR00725 family protein [Deltaproteobacteria bacterium]|nr:TIGR00725 family protein [Deltaproteobacteria bacterium]